MNIAFIFTWNVFPSESQKQIYCITSRKMWGLFRASCELTCWPRLNKMYMYRLRILLRFSSILMEFWKNVLNINALNLVCIQLTCFWIAGRDSFYWIISSYDHVKNMLNLNCCGIVTQYCRALRFNGGWEVLQHFWVHFEFDRSRISTTSLSLNDFSSFESLLRFVS